MKSFHGYLEKIGKYHVVLRNWLAGFRGFKLMEINSNLFFQPLESIKGSPTFFAGTQQKLKGINGWEGGG